MSSGDWQRAKEIFNSALDLDPARRGEYLSEACEGDDDLRQKVEKLLESYESDFMERPVVLKGEANSSRHGPGSKLGRYEIVQRLGAGGMGEVFLARDTQLDRNVAIKFLNEKCELSQTNLQRFIQEAKSASALNHPNILTIHEIGETGGSHYLVSEFIKGKTLREILCDRKLQLSEILDISVQIASALSAAHNARIIHRDIKPENVIVRDDGYVKVLDFGLAKLIPEQPSFIGLEEETIRQNRTAEGVIVGTVRYMSPEQAIGEAVDARTDIFSLGVVMYEMITGRTPFAGESQSVTFANLINKEAPPLSDYASYVPDEMQRTVSMLLSKDRDDRYGSAEDLLEDLRRIRTKDTSGGGRQGEVATAVFHQTNSDVEPRKTGESKIASSSFLIRSALVFGPLVGLLTAVIAFAIYWQQSAVPAQPQIRSLAVLPLRSIDASEDALGLGLADSIIRRLSSTGSVIVRPTSAVRKYVNSEADSITAASELKADAVLEGTIQRSGDRLRVSVNLFRASDGSSIWNDKFDLNNSDIFAMQDTISQKVAAGLKLKLDPSQQARLAKNHTSNSEAYDYFVKGNAEYEQATTSIGDMRAVEIAAEYYSRAVELDPNYALAYARLGATYMRIANFNEPNNPAWVGKATDAWAKAESIDPDLAEVHDARFEYYFSKYGKWDLSRAIQETKIAKKLNPSVGHNSWATLYDHVGLDETAGIAELKRALEIDPTNVSRQYRLSESYRLFGDCDKANEVNLYYFGEPYAAALVCKGDVDQAIPLLETIVKKDPGDIVNRSFLALAYAKKGKRQAAEQLVPALISDSPENRAYHHVTYNIASLYAVTGNSQETVKWLRTTASTGMPNYTAFVRDANFDRVRGTPEFQNFLMEVKPLWERLRREIEGM